MKKIEITLVRGVAPAHSLILEANYDDGEVLRGGNTAAFLGRLEIDQEAHGKYMPADQIRGFLDSVVLPQLNLFSRQIETELIEEEEAALETKVGPAP